MDWCRVARSRVGQIRLLCFTTFLLSSSYVLADDEFDPIEIYTDIKELKISDYEGELIDIRTGQVSQEVVDISIPGNGGMDINISRSYQARPQPQAEMPHSIANWALEVPTITGNSTDTTNPADIENYCDRPYQGVGGYWTSSQLVYQNGEWITIPPEFVIVPRTWAGLTLKLPGKSSNQLLSINGNPFTNTSGITEYRTTDNTKVECIATDKGAYNGFLATTPDGTRYTFDKSYVTSIETGILNDQVIPASYLPVHYHPSKIEDRNGNVLNYEYILDPAGFMHLSRITSNDDREVIFNYTDVGNVWDSQSSKYFLDSITANNQTWRYYYTNYELDRVVRPDGSEWKYDYAGYAGHESYNSNGSLIQVITPAGAQIDYTYTIKESIFFNLGDSRKHLNALQTRIITTANGQSVLNASHAMTNNFATMEVTLNTPHWTKVFNFSRRDDWSLGVIDNYTITDPVHGLLQTTNYEWQPLAQTGDNYVLKRHISITTPKVLTEKKINREQTDYITRYLNHDQYGNPHRIEEVGQATRNRNLTYDIKLGKWLLHLNNHIEIEGEGEINRTYDANGNLTDEFHFGVHTQYAYYPSGDVSQVVDARNKITQYFDYYRGQAQRTIDAENIETKQYINPTGTVAWKQDGRGFKTFYVYDEMNRVVLTDFPIHEDEINEYPNPRTIITRRGNYKKTVEHDELLNVIKEQKEDLSDPNAYIENTRQYDSLGRVTFESEAHPSNAFGKYFTYDALGRLRQTQQELDVFTNYNFLPNNRIETISPLNISIHENHRSFGDPDSKELIRVEAPEGVTLDIGRDLLGNIIQLTQDGLVRTYTFNANKFLTNIVHPEAGEIVIGRDAVGNMLSRSVNNGPSTLYSYDGKNQLKTIDYPETTPDVTLTYDNNGNVINISNIVTDWLYDYDQNNNLTSEKLNIDNLTLALRYTYNDLDYTTKLTYPSGAAVEYDPDALGRPRAALPYINSIEYHANSRPKSITYANGHTVTTKLNSRSFIANIDANIGIAPNPFFETSIINQDYRYDAAGNLTLVKDIVSPENTLGLGYDNLNRLTSATGPWGSGTVGYDVRGNIVTHNMSDAHNYTYNPTSNRLLSISGAQPKSFTYDNYGNVTSNGTNGFTYDHAMNLIGVNGSVNKQYTYDANNRLTKTDKAGETSYWLYTKSDDRLFQYHQSDDSIEEKVFVGTHLIASRKVTELSLLDSNGNGQNDVADMTSGLNPLTNDADQDGLTDQYEQTLGTDPTSSDTDGDGVADNVEVLAGLDPLNNSDVLLDNDNDGLTGIDELQLGTNPTMADTDSDGLNDGDELAFGSNPLIADTDGDGVNDGQEYALGSNPNSTDTDGDGMLDGDEVRLGLNILIDDSAIDSDNDGLTNIEEIALNTDPFNPDTDNDGINDNIDPDPTFNVAVLIPILGIILD